MFRYTIIEIQLDAWGQEFDRKPGWTFDTREDAVERMENLISRHTDAGYSEDGTVWFGTATDGTRMRYLIEG